MCHRYGILVCFIFWNRVCALHQCAFLNNTKCQVQSVNFIAYSSKLGCARNKAGDETNVRDHEEEVI